jgi:hypothetical protein
MSQIRTSAAISSASRMNCALRIPSSDSGDEIPPRRQGDDQPLVPEPCHRLAHGVRLAPNRAPVSASDNRVPGGSAGRGWRISWPSGSAAPWVDPGRWPGSVTSGGATGADRHLHGLAFLLCFLRYTDRGTDRTIRACAPDVHREEAGGHDDSRKPLGIAMIGTGMVARTHRPGDPGCVDVPVRLDRRPVAGIADRAAGFRGGGGGGTGDRRSAFSTI